MKVTPEATGQTVDAPSEAAGSTAAPKAGRGRAAFGWLATAGGAIAAVVALTVLYSHYAPVMNDFEVYYYGGTKVLQTGEGGVGELYAVRDGLPFTYPPFAALLFAGLATLTFGQSSALFIGAALGGAAVVSAWLSRHCLTCAVVSSSTSRGGRSSPDRNAVNFSRSWNVSLDER